MLSCYVKMCDASKTKGFYIRNLFIQNFVKLCLVCCAYHILLFLRSLGL